MSPRDTGDGPGTHWKGCGRAGYAHGFLAGGEICKLRYGLLSESSRRLYFWRPPRTRSRRTPVGEGRESVTGVPGITGCRTNSGIPALAQPFSVRPSWQPQPRQPDHLQTAASQQGPTQLSRPVLPLWIQPPPEIHPMHPPAPVFMNPYQVLGGEGVRVRPPCFESRASRVPG